MNNNDQEKTLAYKFGKYVLAPLLLIAAAAGTAYVVLVIVHAAMEVLQ